MTNRDKPVDWDQLYPGRFIKPGELLGKKYTLTIKDVDLDELESNDGKKKIMGIVSFVETDKGLPLNKTNGICMKSMFGKKVREWLGKRMILFADKWNGDDAIRIWGSPDIKEETAVEVQLPRRKPFTMTMHTKAA